MILSQQEQQKYLMEAADLYSVNTHYIQSMAGVTSVVECAQRPQCKSKIKKLKLGWKSHHSLFFFLKTCCYWSLARTEGKRSSV